MEVPQLTPADSPYGSLDKFEIETEIGRGQFSVVYRAHCKSNGSKVALKKVQLCEMVDAKARIDCMRETSLLQKLDHPNIIKYLASFIEDNELIIVLELADAGDLSEIIQYIRERSALMMEPMIWEHFVQICSAVEHMHSRRIMHRDIKPANVFVTAERVVKLGDLGLGRFFSVNTVAAKTMVGTPYYMSPERVYELPYDFKSDVWSLGCLLYEMAVLQSPFAGDNTSLFSLLEKIVESNYPPIPSDMYGDELRDLVTACTNPDPAERPDIKYVHATARRMYEKFSSGSK